MAVPSLPARGTPGPGRCRSPPRRVPARRRGARQGSACARPGLDRPRAGPRMLAGRWRAGRRAAPGRLTTGSRCGQSRAFQIQRAGGVALGDIISSCTPRASANHVAGARRPPAAAQSGPRRAASPARCGPERSLSPCEGGGELRGLRRLDHIDVDVVPGHRTETVPITIFCSSVSPSGPRIALMTPRPRTATSPASGGVSRMSVSAASAASPRAPNPRVPGSAGPADGRWARLARARRMPVWFGSSRTSPRLARSSG